MEMQLRVAFAQYLSGREPVDIVAEAKAARARWCADAHRLDGSFPSGAPVLHHRKVHICDFDSPEMACGRGANFEPRKSRPAPAR